MGKEFTSEFVGALFTKITHVPEFEKDLKKLLKRFSSLEDDLQTFIKVAMHLFHKQKIDSNVIFHISELGIKSPKIYKAKKFACKALKGKGAQSGIRVIYAYHEDEDWIEFIEIYYKGDKESEDRERIKETVKTTGEAALLRARKIRSSFGRKTFSDSAGLLREDRKR
jgi:mRNA-degrading endonuclease RelE of RelBE toxin-antitoxin system